MMHGHEKSDSVIVAAKPANKAERSAAELVEPRAETKGNAGWQSTLRTQSRACGSQAGTSSGRNAFSSPRAPLRESGTDWDRHCEHRYVSASHDWTISSDDGLSGEVL